MLFIELVLMGFPYRSTHALQSMSPYKACPKLVFELVLTNFLVDC